MSDNSNIPSKYLMEAASILKTCQPLADQLSMYGVLSALTEEDHARLLSFEKLLNADFSDSEWSYLRVASGVKIGGVAALTGCLRRYRTTEQKGPYGQF